MVDPETIDVYAGALDSYLAIPLPEEQIQARQAFVDLIPAGGQVLDLGAGPGSDSLFLMRQGLKVRALDATQAFVDHARANGVDAHLGTFDDLDAQDSYDAIYASFSLLHAPKTDFPRHLKAVKRALKAGGVLFLGMKTGTGEHRDEIGRFYAYYSLEELEDALHNTGFTLVSTTTGYGSGLAGAYSGFALIIAHG